MIKGSVEANLLFGRDTTAVALISYLVPTRTYVTWLTADAGTQDYTICDVHAYSTAALLMYLPSNNAMCSASKKTMPNMLKTTTATHDKNEKHVRPRNRGYTKKHAARIPRSIFLLYNTSGCISVQRRQPPAPKHFQRHIERQPAIRKNDHCYDVDTIGCNYY